MRRLPRSLCAPLVLLLGCALAVCGCRGTREDRTIAFSAGGDQVGFQHGREGVFVADKEGGGLTNIFTPDRDTIAVSTPLWAPHDRRLIFTTARPAAGDRAAPAVAPASADEPAGRVFVRQPVVYTCWLRDEPQGDEKPQLHELFTAQVDDVGYVAANLAVRWHPQGDRVLYVKQVGKEHAVFEIDLNSRSSHRVSPAVDARAVIFDWTPDGSHLVCLFASTPKPQQGNIWIRLPDFGWWHPGAAAPLGDESDSPLERLKGARPAWAKDGVRFAFTTSLPGRAEGEPGRHVLWLGNLQRQNIERILEEKEPMRDLVWHPDGRRLGFVTGRSTGLLRIANVEGGVTTVTPAPVRNFAGWCAKGEYLAYTTPDEIPLKDEPGFSLLLFPDPLARDVLRVAPGDGKGESRAVLSGMRTTFARWSPEEEKLSQWFTFSPTHRSLASFLVNGGLRRGDPTAVIDARTGTVGWMAVNGREKAQIGHYHLLKRDYAQAWCWYEEARRDPAARPDETADPLAASPFRDASFFEYYCLHKLGREEEARAKLAAFRADLAKRLPEMVGNEILRQGNARDVAALRDFFAAEVFLSLDAAEDGEAFFREALAAAKTDDDRFSAALVLSQLLLLEGRCGEYAVLATDVVAPLTKAWSPEPGINLSRTLDLGGLGLVPLARADLLARVPADSVPALLASWAEMWAKAPDELSALGSGLILEGLYQRAGRVREAAEVRQRLRPILNRAGLAVELDGRGANDDLRTWLEAMQAMIQSLLGGEPLRPDVLSRRRPRG